MLWAGRTGHERGVGEDEEATRQCEEQVNITKGGNHG